MRRALGEGVADERVEPILPPLHDLAVRTVHLPERARGRLDRPLGGLAAHLREREERRGIVARDRRGGRVGALEDPVDRGPLLGEQHHRRAAVRGFLAHRALVELMP